MPIEKSDVSYTLNLEEMLRDVPSKDREDAATEAGEYALEKMVDYMDRRVSPVSGVYKKFDPLKNEEYKKYKQKIAGNKKANLRLTGKMIESLDVDADENSFTISVTENPEKAYNHNVGDTVPKRQFMPNDRVPGRNSKFKREIVKGIKETIKKYEKAPTREADTAAENFAKLLSAFKATKREKEIAVNVKTFKIEDIL